MLIGIDIGGTKCAVTSGRIADGSMKIMNKVMFKMAEYSGPSEILDRFAMEIENISVEDAEAIGISCGSPMDAERGIIMSPPNLPGWDNIEIIKYFEDRFGIRTFLQNDANACAIAEWKFGAARGLKNVVFLTFGTGMGAGLILDGKLYSGTDGMAGEIGHIRLSKNGPVGYGKTGSFEGFCSGGGIAQMGKIKANELLNAGNSCGFCKTSDDIEKITAKLIADAAKNGNETAKEIYRISSVKLGQALAIIIDILNPQMIVIGSIYTRCEELIRGAAEAVLEKECLAVSRKSCVISGAALGERIGDYAALSIAALGLEEGKNA